MPFNIFANPQIDSCYDTSELTFSFLGRVLSQTYIDKDSQAKPRFAYRGEIYGVIDDGHQWELASNIAAEGAGPVEAVDDFESFLQEESKKSSDVASSSSSSPKNKVWAVDDFESLIIEDKNEQSEEASSSDSEKATVLSNDSDEKLPDSIVSVAVDHRLLCFLLFDNVNKRHIAYFKPCSDGKSKELVLGQEKLVDVLSALKNPCIARSSNPAVLSNEVVLAYFKNQCQQWIIPISENKHWRTLNLQGNSEDVSCTLYESRSDKVSFFKGMKYGDETEHLDPILHANSETITDHLTPTIDRTNCQPIKSVCLDNQSVLNKIDCGPIELRVQNQLVNQNEVVGAELPRIARLYDQLMFCLAGVDLRLEAVHEELNVDLKVKKALGNRNPTLTPPDLKDINSYFANILLIIDECTNGKFPLLNNPTLKKFSKNSQEIFGFFEINTFLTLIATNISAESNKVNFPTLPCKGINTVVNALMTLIDKVENLPKEELISQSAPRACRR